MKKFLSLLLALTLVLSLVVVPARAEVGETLSEPATPQYTSEGKTPSIRVTANEAEVTGAVSKNTPLTFTAVTEGIVIKKDGTALTRPVFTYTWSGSVSGNNASAPVNATGTSINATCTVAVKENASDETPVYTFPAVSATVNVYDLDNAIDKVYFNDRPYDVTYNASNGSATVYLGNKETLAAGKWQVLAKSGYTVSDQSTNTVLDGTTLKFKVGYGESMTPVEKTISITSGTLSTPAVSITKPTGISNNTVRTNQEVVFSAAVTNKSSNTKYSWTIQDTANGARPPHRAIRPVAIPSSGYRPRTEPTKSPAPCMRAAS